MKKLLLLLSAGAGFFAAGYFVRGHMPEAAGAPAADGLAKAVEPHPAAPPGATHSRPAALADAQVRAFVPGRPFSKGHATEWLLDLVSGLSGDRRGNAITFANNMQSFMTMDDDSVRETLAALEELIATADAKNPERRRNPNGDGKLDSLLEFSMLRLVQTQPEEALAILKKNWKLNDGSTRLMVFGSLAARDPQRAEQLALGLDKEQRKDALESVMYALINKQPQAALDLAARHPETGDEKYRERILEAWVQNDPPAAMAAAVKEMTASNNPEAVRNTIEEWSKHDPTAAAQWANSHEGPGRVIARAMVLDQRARKEPQAVLADYAALQQAGANAQELSRLTSTLAEALARKDVNAARTWAEALPAGDLQSRALHQVAGQWVKNDAPAASEWIRSLPLGGIRDDAAKELSSAIVGHDPASAFEWAHNIQDVKLRESALVNVIANWSKADPEAAKAAMESLPAKTRTP